MRALLLGVAFAAAISASAHAETRRLSGFDSVTASGRFRVEVAVNETFSVTVDGADAARIRTRLDEDTLRIEPVRRPWFGEPRYDAVIRVTLPRLQGVSAVRGALVTATAGGACDDFDATAAMGAGLTVAGLNCATVSAEAAMGAELELAGACERADLSAAMGGAIDTAALECRDIDASAAMGGQIAAFASNSYDASAAMGGDITVRGGANVRDHSTAMGGSIRNQD